jgi:hypothetical protein
MLKGPLTPFHAVNDLCRGFQANTLGLVTDKALIQPLSNRKEVTEVLRGEARTGERRCVRDGRFPNLGLRGRPYAEVVGFPI